MVASVTKFHKEHTWVRIEGGIGVVGISDFAQESLGEILFVEVPIPGTEYNLGDIFGSVESAKNVSDLFSPASGKVVSVNERLVDNPGLVNQDPYGQGWIIKLELKDLRELEQLMSEEEYKQYTAKN